MDSKRVAIGHQADFVDEPADDLAGLMPGFLRVQRVGEVLDFLPADIADGFTARRVIAEWIGFYNTIRLHSALGGRTPAGAYRGGTPVDVMDKPLRALTTYPQAQQQLEERFKRILAA